MCHHEDCALLGALIVVLSVHRFYMKFFRVFPWQLFCMQVKFISPLENKEQIIRIWKKLNKCSDGRRRVTTDGTLYTGLILLLNKIQQGGVNSIKALKILRENGKIWNDCILMVDEMYVEKATQYHNEYVGPDDEGNLYKGIVAFMVV